MRRRKQDQCCSHLNSLSAIKYAIVSLYILVFLTIFGLCLAGRMHVEGGFTCEIFQHAVCVCLCTFFYSAFDGLGALNVTLELIY